MFFILCGFDLKFYRFIIFTQSSLEGLSVEKQRKTEED